MPFGAEPLVLTDDERRELQQMTQSRTLPAGDVMRSRMVLLLADGASYQKIQDLLNTTAPTIARWKERFLKHRIAGLMEERHPGQKPSVRTPKLQAKILAAIKEGPKDGSTHWSCRKLASRFHVSKDTIQRILAQADVRPHRLERYMASDDPDFETKAADVIGLYLAPPQHAAVFCVDEKTAIQALDRLDPVLPLSPGRLERHGFEYYRHGTLSLYAALNTRNGAVLWAKPPRGTPARSLPPSSPNWSPISRAARRFISVLTISRPTRPNGWSNSSRLTAKSISTTPRPTPLGSIRSKTGSPGSSAMSSPAVSSPRSRTWPASLYVTSATTIAIPSPSSGPTATPHGASAMIPMSLLQVTIVPVLTGRSQRITEPAKGKEPAI